MVLWVADARFAALASRTLLRQLKKAGGDLSTVRGQSLGTQGRELSSWHSERVCLPYGAS